MPGSRGILTYSSDRAAVIAHREEPKWPFRTDSDSIFATNSRISAGCSVSSVRPWGKSGSTCCRPFRGEGPIDLSSRADPEVRTLEGCAGVRAQGRLCPAGDLAVHPGLLAVTRGNARALLRCLAWYAALLGPGSQDPNPARPRKTGR